MHKLIGCRSSFSCILMHFAPISHTPRIRQYLWKGYKSFRMSFCPCSRRGILSMGEPQGQPDKQSQSMLAVGIALPLMLLLMFATIIGVVMYHRHYARRQGGPEEPLLPREDNVATTQFAIHIPCLGGRLCPLHHDSSPQLLRS